MAERWSQDGLIVGPNLPAQPKIETMPSSIDARQIFVKYGTVVGTKQGPKAELFVSRTEYGDYLLKKEPSIGIKAELDATKIIAGIKKPDSSHFGHMPAQEAYG